jgi:hypothetical protein
VIAMARRSPGADPDKPNQHSPYCAFKSDSSRLWALVSRDVRLVLVAVLVVSGAPSFPSLLRTMIATLH